MLWSAAHSRSFHLALAAAGTLLLSSCSSDELETTGTASLEVSVFCNQLLDEYAAWRIRCLGGSLDAARAWLGAEGLCEDVVASVAAGRLRYEPSAARSCLQAIAAAAGCSGFDDGPCRAALAGRMALGDPCYLDMLTDECAAGTFCERPTVPVAEVCPSGVCRAEGVLGANCMNDEECARYSLTWLHPYPSWQCGGPGRGCTTLASVGEPCGPGSAKYSCQEPAVCGDDGTCQQPPSSGPCLTLRCGAGTSCIGWGPDSTGTCEPVRSVGGPCGPKSYECGWFLRCSEAGVCMDFPRPGEPCDESMPEFSDCLAGRCVGGICKRLGGLGDPCGPGIGGCGHGTMCEGNSCLSGCSSSLPCGSLGQPCCVGGCDEGTQCSAGTCAPLR